MPLWNVGLTFFRIISLHFCSLLRLLWLLLLQVVIIQSHFVIIGAISEMVLWYLLSLLFQKGEEVWNRFLYLLLELNNLSNRDIFLAYSI